MSILQDLDPQYAKIHAQPSFAWKPVILTGATLLALGGASWALLQARAMPISPDQTLAQASPMANEMTRGLTQTPAPFAKQEIPDAVTKPPSVSAGATIHEGAQPQGGADRRTPTPAPTGSPERAEGSLADVEYRRQRPAPSRHAKTNPAHGAEKPGRRNAAGQSTAKSEKSQLSSGRRTNERDIDIISAIVR